MTEPSPGRGRGLSIGAVLAQLQPDFPDVSISKIRFLEAQGLVTPERTPSGYRTFSERDLARLRYVLTAQRDRFWPLKVIRDALDAIDRGLEPPEGEQPAARPAVPGHRPDPLVAGPAELRRRSTLRLTADEVREAAGLDAPAFDSLLSFGLLRPNRDGHFDEAALSVARAAGALTGYGIEPRHLRPFRLAADREIGLVQQAARPLRGQDDPTAQILSLCLALHTALVKAGLAAG